MLKTSLAILLGCAIATPAMAAPDLDAARRRLVVVNDPLELEATVSTERVARSTRGFPKTSWNDNHLMAIIDKRTGGVRFEVRQTLQYTGVFRNFYRVNYETNGLPETQPLMRVASNRSACDIFDAPNSCFEEVSFEVAEPLLRQVASTDPASTWSMKFKSTTGRDLTFSVDRVEIAALIAAVDELKAKSGLIAHGAVVPTW